MNEICFTYTLCDYLGGEIFRIFFFDLKVFKKNISKWNRILVLKFKIATDLDEIFFAYTLCDYLGVESFRIFFFDLEVSKFTKYFGF